MNIPDNILTEHLKNVYFIIGGSCAGKTTAAIELSKKCSMYYYNSDEMRSAHFARADIINQPALTRNVPDYASLDPIDARKWECDIVREMTPMIIADLIQLSGEHEKVVFEGDIDTNIILPIINPEKIIWLLVCGKITKQEFFNRPDHIHMIDRIKNRADISDKEKEERIYNLTEIACGTEIQPEDEDVNIPDEVKKFGLKYYIRDDNSTVADMMDVIEKHFELK